jgi:DNA-binding transcriptional MerR regulator
MHFAAYYGLQRTAYTVLREADGLEQSRVTNDKDETPWDIAKKQGYENIVKLIEESQEVSESFKAVRYIKDIMGRASMIPAEALKLHKVEPAYLNQDSIYNGSSPSEQGSYINIEPISYEKTKVEDMPSIQGCYVNIEPITDEDVDEAIKEAEDALKQLKHVNEPPALMNSGNSAGSYVDFSAVVAVNSAEPLQPRKALKEEVDPNSSYDLVPAPIPLPRSPKAQRKMGYSNCSLDQLELNQDESHNSEVTLRPKNKKHSNCNQGQDASLKRKSIGPIYSNLIPWDKHVPVNADSSSDYQIPRPVNADYQIPPAEARPVLQPQPITRDTLDDEDDFDRKMDNPVLKKKAGTIPKTKDGYWIIDELDQGDNEAGKELTSTKVAKESGPAARCINVDREKKLNRKQTSLENKEAFLDPYDVELLHLIEDFKTEGYTLEQIGFLFEHWKSRPEVQFSMEQKKENLRKIREEYKKIQGKKPLLGKITNFFAGNALTPLTVFATLTSTCVLCKL